MKTTQTRLSNGQYGKSRSKVLRYAFFLIVIGLMLTYVNKHYWNVLGEADSYWNAPETSEIAPQSEVQTDSDLQSIMDEEGFRKAMELKARKIKAERSKADEVARHEESMKAIEGELEEIRKAELDGAGL